MPKPSKRPYPAQPAIKAEMKLRGLNARQVAEELDLSHGYVTLLLNGHARSDGALQKIRRLVKSKPRI